MKFNDELLNDKVKSYYSKEFDILIKIAESLDGCDFGEIKISVEIKPMAFHGNGITSFNAELIGNPDEILINSISLPVYDKNNKC